MTRSQKTTVLVVLNDDDGHNPLDIADAQLELQADVQCWPGEPMVMYERDGSGYPGSPPEFEITNVLLVSMCTTDGEVELDDDQRREVIAWVESRIEHDDAVRALFEEEASSNLRGHEE